MIRNAGGWKRTILASFFMLLVASLGCNSYGSRLLSRDKNDKALVDSHGTLPPPPSRYSFRIAPYVFLSDFEIDRNKPLFQELAKLRDRVYGDLHLPPTHSIVQVYLFENKERYEEFMRAAYPDLPPRRAFFVQKPKPFGGSDDLLVYTYWGDRIQQDLRHELTHALLHSVIRDVPLWLDEGLAEYFELPPSEQGINASHVETLRRDFGDVFHPDLDRLERMKDVRDMKSAEYREAWLWTHWMMQANPETRAVLLAYLQELRSKNNPSPLAQRLTVLAPNLNEAFKRHLDRLELPINARAVPLPTPSAPR